MHSVIEISLQATPIQKRNHPHHTNRTLIRFGIKNAPRIQSFPTIGRVA